MKDLREVLHITKVAGLRMKQGKCRLGVRSEELLDRWASLG